LVKAGAFPQATDRAVTGWGSGAIGAVAGRRLTLTVSRRAVYIARRELLLTGFLPTRARPSLKVPISAARLPPTPRMVP
ncbi:MAG: hypothetical protein ACKOJF_01225, partial [Planctomycetaceae bacterium]